MRDAKNLEAHLLKDRGTRIEMLNSVAPDLHSVISDIMLSKDGSRAEAAFLHIVISPSTDMTDDEIRRAAEIVMKHFEATDHQAALIFHDKDRANGKGGKHGHLVLSRIGPGGNVVAAGFEKIKLETAMRIVEFELGEPVNLGRHHASAIKWLRNNGRSDVAEWLELSHGSSPEKPSSAVSPEKRQKILRHGVDLATATAILRTAWERSDNASAFVSALYEQGFQIAPGEKPGVFIVSTHSGTEIGALDRLLKQKRGVVSQRMKEYTHEPTFQPETEPTSNHGASQSDLRRGADPETAPAIDGDTGTDRGRTNRTDPAVAGSNTSGPTSIVPADRGHGKENRQIDKKQGLIMLDKVRLSSSTIIAAQDLKTHHRPFSRLKIIRAARQLKTYINGWEWVREFRDDLLAKIREIKDRVFGTDQSSGSVTIADMSVSHGVPQPHEADELDENEKTDYQPPRPW
jgi:hypothetical protein